MAGECAADQLLGGRYALVDVLGHGASGVVWRARDQLLHRDVAVKEIRSPLVVGQADDTALRDAIMREARAAARLNHPGAVTVFDVVEDDGRPLIVMELVDAPTLADLVESNGPLPPGEVAAIGAELLDALDAGHAAGIVHRDVKPRNVMIAPSGRVRLADFGVAAVLDDARMTTGNAVVGSPAYMAPEQVMGGEIGPPVDIWALGATLYYAVEGRPPYDKASAIPTMTAIALEPPRPPERAGVLAPLLEALLTKDPAARPTAPFLRLWLGNLSGGPEQGRANGADATSRFPVVSAGLGAADIDIADGQMADTGLADTGLAAPEVADTGMADTGMADTGLADIDMAAPGLADTDMANTGLADTGLADTELADVEMADVEMADVEMADVEMADVEMADVEMAYTELADTELADIEMAELDPAGVEIEDIEVPGGPPSAPGGPLEPGPAGPVVIPKPSPEVPAPAPADPTPAPRPVPEEIPTPIVPTPPTPEPSPLPATEPGPTPAPEPEQVPPRPAPERVPPEPAPEVVPTRPDPRPRPDPTGPDPLVVPPDPDPLRVPPEPDPLQVPSDPDPLVVPTEPDAMGAAAEPAAVAGGPRQLRRAPGGRPAGAARPATQRRISPRAPWVVAAVAIVGVVLLAALLAGRGDGGDEGGGEGQASPGTAAGSSSASAASVPSDWVAYVDPATGFRISHPPGWTVQVDGSLTDITDPATGAYLRIDHIEPPGPSPEGAWYDFEPRFAAENPGYRRVRIEPTTYAGFPAAIWEYTYGGGLRAVDLGFVTGRYGFALNFQTPAGDWDRLQPVFEAFKASFRAPSS